MKDKDNSLSDEKTKKEPRVTKIGSINVFLILILGIAGQIAWVVENSWFNTFVFDEITPNPWPVAWMVAVSAITATFTTLKTSLFNVWLYNLGYNYCIISLSITY